MTEGDARDLVGAGSRPVAVRASPCAVRERPCAVASARSWRFVAPLGPIEAGELTWYLEKYAVWPSHYFRGRAKKVEADLETWGRQLHDAAMPVAHAANVMQAWAELSPYVWQP